jgi:hypothetical protein
MPKIYLEGEQLIYLEDKTLKVCNTIYATDPQLIVTVVKGIYPNSAISSEKELIA